MLDGASIGRYASTLGRCCVCPRPTGLLFGELVRQDVLAAGQEAFRRHSAKEVNQHTDKPGPTGLVARAEAGAIVAVKMLVEQDVISPVRVALEFCGAAVGGSTACLIAEEDPCQSIRELVRDIEQVHHFSGARRALDFEAVPVIEVVVKQS